MDTFDIPVELPTLSPAAAEPSLVGFDFVELYVGNALQAAHFFRSAFGLATIARAGGRGSTHEGASFVLERHDVRLVVTSALDANHAVADAVRRHGDSVADVALRVEDAAAVFDKAVTNGARPVLPPTVREDEYGRVVRAVIGGPGEFVHSLIERQDYAGAFLPGFEPAATVAPQDPPSFRSIDHVAFCVERGTMNQWADFYERTLGFEQLPPEDTVTEHSGMRSRVVQYGPIRFPLLEPADGRRRSQIEDYLDRHGGPGAQHIALLADDIIGAVGRLKAGGIEFLKAPRAYYEMLPDRLGAVDEDVAALAAHDILLDRDEWGSLLQIFSKPIQSRPTLFFEVIQRNRARGFGSGNIRALFQALEIEQTRRGADAQ